MAQTPVQIASSFGQDLVGLIARVREEGKEVHGTITMTPDQIGLAVFNALKEVETNDAVVWVVACAARDYALEEAIVKYILWYQRKGSGI